MTRWRGTVLVGLALLATSPAAGQERRFHTRGLAVGVNVARYSGFQVLGRTLPWSGGTTQAVNTRTDAAIGFAGRIGWGILPWITVAGLFDLTSHNEIYCESCEVSFSRIALEARLNAAVPRIPIVPYAALSIGSVSYGYHTLSGNLLTLYGGDDGTSRSLTLGLDWLGADLFISWDRIHLAEYIPQTLNTRHIGLGYTLWWPILTGR